MAVSVVTSKFILLKLTVQGYSQASKDAHTHTTHTPPHLHQSMHLPQRLETTACTQGRIMVRWKGASVLHLFSDIEAP